MNESVGCVQRTVSGMVRCTHPTGLEVRQQVAIQTGIAIDHGLNLLRRLVERHPVIDTDPKFREVRPDDFVGDFRAADVRSKIAHGFDAAHVEVLQTGAQRVERLFDLPRDFECVPPRQLFNDEQQTRAVADHRVTDRRGEPFADVTPNFMRRLVEESGASITGAWAMAGNR